MNRRSFIASTLATGFAAKAEQSKIGIGFLGASYSHAEPKLRAVQASSDWSLMGVAETRPAVREKLAGMGVSVISRQELLQNSGIRVIAVESDPREHAADGKAVLAAGKHLHLEKVPATNMRDMQAIVALARERNLLVQTGYMWRYHPSIRSALEAARAGWLGSVFLLKGSISNQLAQERRAEWAEIAGGIMFELGCHLIDPMIRLMGRPHKVTPVLRTDGSPSDHLRDNTVAVMEWDNAMGIVQAANMLPGYNRYRAFEIHGTKGSAIVNPIEPPALNIDLAEAAAPYKKGRQTVPQPEYKRFIDDFAELAAAIRGETKLRVTLDQELSVQDAVLRCSGMS